MGIGGIKQHPHLMLGCRVHLPWLTCCMDLVCFYCSGIAASLVLLDEQLIVQIDQRRMDEEN